MYDAIIVGARCAGASTALLLARRGYRVLLIDKAHFPSDFPLSTHLIWQSGVARLQKWGLLKQVQESGCPPLGRCTIDFGPFTVTGTPPPAGEITTAYAPRRIVLDQILVDAAVQAGVEVRTGFTVTDLVTDDDCVVGIQGRGRGNATLREKTRIVVGADGMHSTVARRVGALDYNTKPPLQGTYFAYWSGIQVEGIELYLRDYRAAYGWATNDDLTLIGVNWTGKDFPEVRGDIEGNYFQVLNATAPALAEQVHAGRREGKWIGGSIPSYVRRPYGPGWALVGDAGYQKDPCTAQGISDAFRDAELLAEALEAGLSGRQPMDEALATYERQRNDAAKPMYEFTCQLAPFGPPSPEMQHLFAALPEQQDAINQFLGVFAGTVPIPEFFAPENVNQILAAT